MLPNIAIASEELPFTAKGDGVIKTAVKILVLLTLSAVPCAAEIIIVDQQWPYDFNNIQAAIDYAGNGDYIFVFPGTYTGPGNYNIDFLGKAVTVSSIDPNDPYIVASTIIDCDCNAAGYDPAPFFPQGSNRGFYLHSGEDANSIIQGFTIIRAVPSGVFCHQSSPEIADCIIRECYNAIYCHDSNAVIDDCAISDCIQGISLRGDTSVTDSTINYNSNGIRCYDGNAVITNCTISNNNDSGICCLDSNAVITGCIITDNNAATHGGGIYCEESSPEITDCTITDNFAEEIGGGIYGCSGPITNCTISENSAVFGGGLAYCDGPVTDCIINSNSADYLGGGICCCDGPVTNCTISSNSANAGGGLAECDCPITNCAINNNSAGGGGGLYQCGGSITNCIISNNSAVYDGGGLINCHSQLAGCAIVNNSAGGNGGGMYGASSPIITNCTIVGNSAGQNGGGIGASRILEISNSTIAGNFAGLEDGGIDISYAAITNCIVWDNWSGQIKEGFHPPTVAYCDIQGGYEGVGNIDVDPCFVAPGFWADINDHNIIVEPNHPNAVWVHGDYHLKSAGWSWDAEHGRWTYDDVTSRCIDAGNPGSPLADEPLSIYEDPNNEWGHNLRINMGAFGGTAEASIPPYDWALLSDTTNDGISDFNDLQILSSLWLNTGESLYADFNRDEDIDFLDFALLADDWLLQTSWH